MELIYQDLEQWELKQQYEFINSLAPDFRANLALHCPDIINLARCSNLASKEILAIKDLCGSISSSAVARLGAVCAHHHHEKLPWSPLALAVTATVGLSCTYSICQNSKISHCRTVIIPCHVPSEPWLTRPTAEFEWCHCEIRSESQQGISGCLMRYPAVGLPTVLVWTSLETFRFSIEVWLANNSWWMAGSCSENPRPQQVVGRARRGRREARGGGDHEGRKERGEQRGNIQGKSIVERIGGAESRGAERQEGGQKSADREKLQEKGSLESFRRRE